MANFADTKTRIMESLKNHFRPEFLNRLDDIIIFNPLSRATIREIVDLQLKLVQNRLAFKNIELVVSDEAREWLAREGYSQEYGVRPLKRLIQTKLLNAVAEFIIARRVENGGTLTVELKDDEPLIELKKSVRVSRRMLASAYSNPPQINFCGGFLCQVSF